MYQHKNRPTCFGGHKKKRSALSLLMVLLMTAYCLPTAAQQKTNKIQQSIDAIKEANNNETSDYITDGKRIVWVKSYKNWTPEDFATLKKEAPHVLKFLRQAIDHNRMDVLEQLLPDYYRYRGGVKAFAEDIKKLT